MPYPVGGAGGGASVSANPFANSTLPAGTPIYVGTRPHPAESDTEVQAQEAGKIFGTDPVAVAAGDLAVRPFQLGINGPQIKQLQQELIDANYLNKKDKSGIYDQATQNGYETLLQDVAGYTAAGQTVTPQDLLTQRASILKTARQSSTQSSVTLTDPITANALIDKTISAYTGRSANQQDRADFLNALNTAQKTNPSTSTTTTDGAGNSSTVSNSAQVDPSAFADQYARSGVLGTQTNTAQVGTSFYKAALSILGAGGH